MTLLRVIKFALQDIVRNISLSLMTVVVLILTLLAINTLIIVRALTRESITTIKNQIDVSIYFDPKATEEEIQEVKDYVAAFPEVVGTTFLTRDEVIASFREAHKDNPNVLTALQELGDNPLGPTLIIKTREPENYQKVIQALNIPEYETIIEAKTFADTEKAIDRVQIITTQVERFSLVIAALFGLIAFIIIFNTIRVAIYTQRTEISIKRLVGATNWFIRGPYIIEGLIFTLVSVGVSTLLVFIAVRMADPYIALIFERQAVLTNYFRSHILVLLGTQLGAVFLLTLLSSSLAMRKYLKV